MVNRPWGPAMGPKHIRLRSHGVLVLLAGVLAAGCGGDGSAEREYAVPDTLCGLQLPQRLYDPLFPPGSGSPDSSDLSRYFPYLDTNESCSVSVEGEDVILVQTWAADSFADFLQRPGPEDLAGEYDLADGEPVDGPYDAMVWPGLALAGTPCEPGEAVAIGSFTIAVEAAYPEDDEESVRVLTELIQPLMAAALEQSVCTPGENPRSEFRQPRDAG